jgi:hypothetical protein
LVYVMKATGLECVGRSDVSDGLLVLDLHLIVIVTGLSFWFELATATPFLFIVKRV